MKTIGLLGGMSWESSLEYYRLINQKIQKILGGLSSAKIILYSFNFKDIECLQREGKWKDVADYLITGAQRLEASGADGIVICSNTAHIVSEEVKNAINIPIIQIIDSIGKEIQRKNIKKVGLLGTIFIMKDGIYKEFLKDQYNIEIVIPEEKDQYTINSIIFSELVQGNITDTSKNKLLAIISKLIDFGVEGIILGCTELPLIINQVNVSIPLFDSTEIHAESAVKFILSE